MTYSSCGKQVMHNYIHFADAKSPEAAEHICAALNAYCEPRDEPDVDQTEFHAIRRESDEYVCTNRNCRMRWPVEDGEKHP